MIISLQCVGCGDSFEKWNTRAHIPFCKICNILFKKKWLIFKEWGETLPFYFNRWSKTQTQFYGTSNFEGHENYTVCGICDNSLKIGEYYVKYKTMFGVPDYSLRSWVDHTKCTNLIHRIKQTYPELSQLSECIVKITYIKKRDQCSTCGKVGFIGSVGECI